MLRELRESLILRPKTPNQNKHQKSPSYYFSTISNNAPTKHTSRDNTVLASGDLLSFVDKSPKSILTNKYSTSNSKKNKKILKEKFFNNNKSNNYYNNIKTNNPNSLNNIIQSEYFKRPKTPNSNRNSRTQLKNSNIKNIKNENTKSFFDSIDKTIPVKRNKDYYYTIDNDMNNLEGMISSIKLKGFNKFQNEIDEKIEQKLKLENSISVLKSKLNMYENQKKNIKQEDAKNLLQIQNMRNVSERYKSINEGIEKYQKDIPIYKPQIDKLKNETIKINTQIIEYKREIDLMKNQIQKLNKMISDRKREKDNLRPALKLLQNHIMNLEQKIKSFDIGKSDFMINVSNFVEKGINY